MDDDTPPERVRLTTIACNENGALLIKQIYLYLVCYSFLLIFGALTLVYVAGKASVLSSVFVMFYTISRADKFKLGRIKSVRFELLWFILLPIIVSLGLSAAIGELIIFELAVFVMFFPFFVASVAGYKLLMRAKNNSDMALELSSRSRLYEEYLTWLHR